MSAEACARDCAARLRAGWRLLALESFEEERALRVLERAARAESRALRSWSLAAGLGPGGEGAGSLGAAVEAMARVEEPALFVLLDAHDLLGDAAGVRRLRDALPAMARRRQSVVLLAPALELPLAIEREAARVALPLPEAEEMGAVLERVAGSAREQLGEATLGACARAALGLSAAEAARIFRMAWIESEGDPQGLPLAIVQEKRRALRRTPALDFLDAGEGLAAVGGLGELKRWLRERRRAFEGAARRFGLPAPRGLLLLGVQGCGKSLCAKAVAREWRFPLLRLDLAAAFGDPGRPPELTVREAVAVAESLAPAVLWIDEIEKGLSASGADLRASRVFGAFLTWLAEKRSPVFVTATANDVAQLPPELLRRGRFDELFFVDLPTEAERAEILAIHLERRGRDPKQFPLAELAARAERLSGAELEQAVTAALWTAFAEERELAENDLANALQETVPLYDTYEERVKELRSWARTRARPATIDARMVDLFARA